MGWGKPEKSSSGDGKARGEDARNRGASPSGERTVSLVGPEMRIDGDVTTEGSIRIDGRVAGAVEAGQSVVIGQDGVVDGDLSATDAVIAGQITGCVTTSKRAELQPTAQVEGELRTHRLQLEDGATLNGSVEVGEMTVEVARSADSGKGVGSGGSASSPDAGEPGDSGSADPSDGAGKEAAKPEASPSG